VQNNSVGFCALFGLLPIRMLHFLIDPAGTPNAVAASAMALLIISAIAISGVPVGSSRKASARAGALPSDQFAQLPITPLANFDRPGEIGIIAQTPPQPHIGCIAVAPSHLHGSEEVVVAIIDRRLAITGAGPPLQDQVAVIKAADIT
jgi:hypothetical protein